MELFLFFELLSFKGAKHTRKNFYISSSVLGSKECVREEEVIYTIKYALSQLLISMGKICYTTYVWEKQIYL